MEEALAVVAPSVWFVKAEVALVVSEVVAGTQADMGQAVVVPAVA